jgi:hypothetical protein
MHLYCASGLETDRVATAVNSWLVITNSCLWESKCLILVTSNRSVAIILTFSIKKSGIHFISTNVWVKTLLSSEIYRDVVQLYKHLFTKSKSVEGSWTTYENWLTLIAVLVWCLEDSRIKIMLVSGNARSIWRVWVGP